MIKRLLSILPTAVREVRRRWRVDSPRRPGSVTIITHADDVYYADNLTPEEVAVLVRQLTSFTHQTTTDQ